MTAHARMCPDDQAPGQEEACFGPLGAAIADELVRAAGMLGELAYDLGSEPDTLRRHMSSLQDIDRITQIQLAVADLLRSTGDIEQSIAGVTLEDVNHRLRAAMGSSRNLQ